MDIYCAKCGEPWEMDSLHEEVSERFGTWDPSAEVRQPWGEIRYGKTVLPADRPYEDLFAEVRADFYRQGCKAIGGRCSEPSTETDRTYGLTRQEAAGALYELLGDDMDGAAAMLEDLF